MWLIDWCKKGSTVVMRLKLFRVFVLLWALFSPVAGQAQLDTLKVRSDLKRMTAEYERAIRRFAPHRLGGSSSSCDEIVGRFCLTYDVGPEPDLGPEPEEIKRVRDDVIDAFQKAARQLPRDSSIAGPLIRYLIEGGRAQEAVSEAEAFAQGHRGDAWANLLLGFALHYCDRTEDAEQAFERALKQLDEREARRAAD